MFKGSVGYEAYATWKQESLTTPIEAIEVGIEMGGGPAIVSARFALEIIEEFFEK